MPSVPAILMAVGLQTGCHDQFAWNDVFKREGLAGSRGWTGGDAAISVALPGAGDRILWVFGDSWVTGWNPDTDERVPSDFGVDLVAGTTIAIQSLASGRSAATALRHPSFWARHGSIPVGITHGALGIYSAFFSHGVVGVDPVPGARLWPSSALCLDCEDPDGGELLLSFVEVKFCNPTRDGSGCVPLCGLIGTDPEGCTVGIEVLGDVLSVVPNAVSSPEFWSGSGARIGDDVRWGRAFLQVGDEVLIYGGVAADEPGTTDLVLARAATGEVLDPSQWWFWTTGGWVQGLQGSPHLALVAEDVGSVMSVHEITRRDLTAYLLVHAHPTRDHYLHVRLSESFDSWAPVDATTPRIDLSTMDPSLQAAAFGEFLAGDCSTDTPPGGFPDLRRCGKSYHGVGHEKISRRDALGIASLFFSYIVPHGTDPSRPTHGDYYRPKFGSIELDRLPPWCSAAGRECLGGIEGRFASQRLAEGEEWSWRFDLSRASDFRATIVAGSGDPDLYVKFGSPPTPSSYDCRPLGQGWEEECRLEVPSGETSAWIMVRGRAASTFHLVTEHAGP
jgi:hypothetical protein